MIAGAGVGKRLRRAIAIWRDSISRRAFETWARSVFGEYPVESGTLAAESITKLNERGSEVSSRFLEGRLTAGLVKWPDDCLAQQALSSPRNWLQHHGMRAEEDRADGVRGTGAELECRRLREHLAAASHAAMKWKNKYQDLASRHQQEGARGCDAISERSLLTINEPSSRVHGGIQQRLCDVPSSRRPGARVCVWKEFDTENEPPVTLREVRSPPSSFSSSCVCGLPSRPPPI